MLTGRNRIERLHKALAVNITMEVRSRPIVTGLSISIHRPLMGGVLFKPDDLPAGVRRYHGFPNRAAASLPEYFPLEADTRLSEEIRIHGGHSWQFKRWLGPRVPVENFKFTDPEILS